MDVHVRQLLLQCAAEALVQVALHLGRQAGLDADLGRAQIPRLFGAPHYLLRRQQVALLGAMVAAEGAEAAALDADVREVDVAVDDVRHDVAHLLAAQRIRREHERLHVGAGAVEERDRFFDRQIIPRQRVVDR